MIVAALIAFPVVPLNSTTSLSTDDAGPVTSPEPPPPPAGVAHVPSPRQKVVELAPVPLPRLETGRFPVTSDARFTAVPADHVSAAVRLMIPVPDKPSTAARSLARARVIEPDVVIGPPDAVIPAAGAVILTLVTAPPPATDDHVPSPLRYFDASPTAGAGTTPF